MKGQVQNEFMLGTKGVFAINGFVLGATSVPWNTVQQVELVLKIVLLVVTIGYTSYRWRKAIKKDNGDE